MICFIIIELVLSYYLLIKRNTFDLRTICCVDSRPYGKCCNIDEFILENNKKLIATIKQQKNEQDDTENVCDNVQFGSILSDIKMYDNENEVEFDTECFEGFEETEEELKWDELDE